MQDWVRTHLPGGDRVIAEGFSRVVTQNEDAAMVLADVKSQLAEIYANEVEPHLG